MVQPLPGAQVQWPAGAEVLVTAEAGDWARPLVLGLMRSKRIGLESVSGRTIFPDFSASG